MLGAKGNDSVIAEGKFKPTDESLKHTNVRNGSEMPNSEYGLIGDLKLYLDKETGMPEICTYRMCIIKTKNVTQVKLTVSICIILNTTDILRNLDTKTSFLCGRPKDGILRN